MMGLACRTGAGTVPRLLLEGLLQKEARGMLAHVSAATVLDLLTVHTVGEHLFGVTSTASWLNLD
jgi:hypothetical protein